MLVQPWFRFRMMQNGEGEREERRWEPNEEEEEEEEKEEEEEGKGGTMMSVHYHSLDFALYCVLELVLVPTIIIHECYAGSLLWSHGVVFSLFV